MTTAPTLWTCLTEAGVPDEYRSAASLALIRFINAHTADMRAETERLNDSCSLPASTGRQEK